MNAETQPLRIGTMNEGAQSERMAGVPGTGDAIVSDHVAISPLKWLRRFVRGLAWHGIPCERRNTPDCGSCPGPRAGEESSCDRGG